MNEVQLVNRCFGGHCPQDQKKSPEQQKEEKIKESLVAARQKKRKEDANKVLHNLAYRLHCKGRLSKLVKAVETQVRKGSLPVWVYEVLIERLESQRIRDELSDQEIVDLEEGKFFLKQFKR